MPFCPPKPRPIAISRRVMAVSKKAVLNVFPITIPNPLDEMPGSKIQAGIVRAVPANVTELMDINISRSGFNLYKDAAPADFSANVFLAIGYLGSHGEADGDGP